MVRPIFDLGTIPPITWFPGHMASTLRQMKDRISNKIDYVIEVRDARVPLSCINPVFEELFQSKKRIIVYNKIDLAGDRFSCVNLSESDNKSFIGTVCISAKVNDPKKQQKAADSILHIIEQRYPPSVILSQAFRLRGLVVGIPNVGKSTLINTLRSVGIGRRMGRFCINFRYKSSTYR